MVDHLVRAAKRARERPANPDLVLADRVLVVERVERHNALDVGGRDLEPLGDKLDRFLADVAVLLLAQVEERERRAIELRLKDAHLPRIKTLEEFDFAQSPHIPASRIRALAEGGYLTRAEPVLLIGEPGTGKSHLATGLAIAACRQRRRVRFITAAALVNQLVEAQREQTLSRMLARWARIELIVLDELGYVPLAEVAAELLFQVIADRAEKAAIIVTTNLPFSEWPQVFTNARLCKAVLDRLTDQAHIIETGSESYRFRRTRSKKQKQSSINTMSPE